MSDEQRVGHQRAERKHSGVRATTRGDECKRGSVGGAEEGGAGARRGGAAAEGVARRQRCEHREAPEEVRRPGLGEGRQVQTAGPGEAGHDHSRPEVSGKPTECFPNCD